MHHFFARPLFDPFLVCAERALLYCMYLTFPNKTPTLGSMNEIVDIPSKFLTQLNLHDGEKAVGELHGDVVRFTVVRAEEKPPSKLQVQNGLAFLEKWKGIGKNLLEKDLSNDPRAEYLLSR